MQKELATRFKEYYDRKEVYLMVATQKINYLDRQ